jgi:hypothetical protein
MVGSSPARSRRTAIIEVVVVLPWEPATAIPYFRRISSASISARGMIGTWRRRASTTSGFEGFTAEDTTTTSVASTCSARCPSWTRTPSDRSLEVEDEDFRSEPLTV